MHPTPVVVVVVVVKSLGGSPELERDSIYDAGSVTPFRHVM